MTRAGMAKHLAACPKRKEAIADAERGTERPEALYHLRVRDAWEGWYWLDLEMRGSARLDELDYYLREIWLECCGHMSRFSIGGWRADEIPRKLTVDRVFASGVELTHIYDFGTESVTLIKAAAVRTGRPVTAHPIALMARNLPPEYECIVCGEPAARLCLECLYEDNVWGTLCEEHAAGHPHGDYGEPLKLVNSPRIGLCGYDGPADPPY
jgi:hypothetical protein